jgi:starvation-inducible DNA-binding protein
MTDTRHAGPSTTTGESDGRSRGSQPVLHQHGVEVQRFGEMRMFPIALSNQARAESGELLNHILADSIILYSLYKKQVWFLAEHLVDVPAARI